MDTNVALQAYTAELVLTPQGLAKDTWVVARADTGRIESLARAEAAFEKQGLRLNGVLMPGFVNAHCHLELSHLAGTIPARTGIVGFIKEIMAARGRASQAEQAEAAAQAINRMVAGGTVAVGDISNTAVTAHVKAALRHRLCSHTFVEALGASPAPDAQTAAVARATATLQAFHSHGLSASIVPHAPYSVSRGLFAELWRLARQHSRPVSLHVLESPPEREWLFEGSGPLAGFLGEMGVGGSEKSPGLSAILPKPPIANPMLLVHLAEASRDELPVLRRGFENPYWVLCPRSNQFIHNTLPNFQLFDWASGRVCLATDSLASCPTPDVLAEVLLVQDVSPEIPLERLLQAITQNPADALCFGGHVGRLEPGLRPGLVLLPLADGPPDAPPRLAKNAKAQVVLAAGF